MATVDTIHTHGYQHFDNLQLSSREFYKLLLETVKSYEFPDVACDVMEMKEGGIFSAKRQYFCVSWKRHNYLVCASPFGKSFFISWWHREGANATANLASRFGKLGRAVASNMERKSLFEVDATMMFLSSMNTIIQSAIDKIKLDKGYTLDNHQLAN